jgi:hypothetical protein
MFRIIRPTPKTYGIPNLISFRLGNSDGLCQTIQFQRTLVCASSLKSSTGRPVIASTLDQKYYVSHFCNPFDTLDALCTLFRRKISLCTSSVFPYMWIQGIILVGLDCGEIDDAQHMSLALILRHAEKTYKQGRSHPTLVADKWAILSVLHRRGRCFPASDHGALPASIRHRTV